MELKLKFQHMFTQFTILKQIISVLWKQITLINYIHLVILSFKDISIFTQALIKNALSHQLLCPLSSSTLWIEISIYVFCLPLWFFLEREWMKSLCGEATEQQINCASFSLSLSLSLSLCPFPPLLSYSAFKIHLLSFKCTIIYVLGEKMYTPVIDTVLVSIILLIIIIYIYIYIYYFKYSELFLPIATTILVCCVCLY